MMPAIRSVRQIIGLLVLACDLGLAICTSSTYPISPALCSVPHPAIRSVPQNIALLA
jgi:hypothetical protein